MGLSGGRKRVKIGNDPNNTNWSRNSTSYGHRMLLSQGWAPGSTLGASNPAYSKHLTQASHSHIKVMMRDDNLGLGAKKGSGQEAGECVGLDAFQAMLGRLNGKSEEALGKEQAARDDLRRRDWVERRGKGLINFVYGGRLVGDDMKDKDEVNAATESKGPEKTTKPDAGISTVEKKRKSEKKEKKARKSKVEDQPEQLDLDAPSELKKKSKKRRHREDEEAPQPTKAETSRDGSEERLQESEDKQIRKALRKAEKAEKRERKRLKREAKAAKRAQASTDDSESESESEVKTDIATPKNAVKETETLTPKEDVATPGSSVSGRHMTVRARYIAAKRRAVMDPQALKEILMVKA